MEEIEVPTEHLHEEMHHLAHGDRMNTFIAFSSAIIAALAAVAALMSGHHANEAMMEQIRASNSWNYYQAKGIKAAILSHQDSPSPKDLAKLDEYAKQQAETKAEAEAQTKLSEKHLVTHETLARAVTFFQVAISIGAIAALTHRRRFWWVSLGFGAIGLFFLACGIFGPS